MEHLGFSQQILLVLVTGGLALLGSLITGLITFYTAARLRDAERNKRSLIRVYRDIAAFHRLEERYAEVLAQASDSHTAEAWKREVRRKLRDQGFASPTDKATAHFAEARIEELC
jgi:hypothetical protein